MKINSRVAIFTKDVQRITGRTERSARKLLQHLRRRHGKEATQFISCANSASPPVYPTTKSPSRSIEKRGVGMLISQQNLENSGRRYGSDTPFRQAIFLLLIRMNPIPPNEPHYIVGSSGNFEAQTAQAVDGQLVKGFQKVAALMKWDRK